MKRPGVQADPDPGAAVNGHIVVTGLGEGLPFSQGLLSESLLANATDPSRAIAILEIQRHLLDLPERDGVPVVDNTPFDQSVQCIVAHVTSRLEASDAGRARE